jgi:hypothetical protein
LKPCSKQGVFAVSVKRILGPSISATFIRFDPASGQIWLEEQAFAGERLCERFSGSTALDRGGQGAFR